MITDQDDDVDVRLGCKTGDGSAADVLDCDVGDEGVVEIGGELGGDAGEVGGPGGVVGDDLDEAHGCWIGKRVSGMCVVGSASCLDQG